MSTYQYQSDHNKERDEFYISFFIIGLGIAIYSFFLINMGSSHENFSMTRTHAAIFFFGMLCHTLRTFSEYQTVLNKDSMFDEDSADFKHYYEAVLTIVSVLFGLAWLLIAGFAFIAEIAIVPR